MRAPHDPGSCCDEIGSASQRMVRRRMQQSVLSVALGRDAALGRVAAATAARRPYLSSPRENGFEFDVFFSLCAMCCLRSR